MVDYMSMVNTKKKVLELIEKYNELKEATESTDSSTWASYKLGEVEKEIIEICRTELNKRFIACTELYKLEPDPMFFGDQYDPGLGWLKIISADEYYISFQYKDYIRYNVVNTSTHDNEVKTVIVDETETMPLEWLNPESFSNYCAALKERKIADLKKHIERLNTAIERTKVEISHYESIKVTD